MLAIKMTKMAKILRGAASQKVKEPLIFKTESVG